MKSFLGVPERQKVAFSRPQIVGVEFETRDVVGHQEIMHLVQPCAVLRMSERYEHLDSTVEIASHHVGRPDDVQGLTRLLAVFEAVQP